MPAGQCERRLFYASRAPAARNLGIVAREAKDYAKAEAYYLRALASREKSLGPKHPDIAANLINLANVYRSKGDYAR
jgi:tetratricopeptide (TPR) repeat protein